MVVRPVVPPGQTGFSFHCVCSLCPSRVDITYAGAHTHTHTHTHTCNEALPCDKSVRPRGGRRWLRPPGHKLGGRDGSAVTGAVHPGSEARTPRAAPPEPGGGGRGNHPTTSARWRTQEGPARRAASKRLERNALAARSGSATAG